MTVAVNYKPGDLVKVRGREWVVLPETQPDLLKLRPLGGSEDDATLIYLPTEPEPPVAAQFDLPDPAKPGSQAAALLLRDSLRLKLRAGAGPFRSFGNILVQPRAYQLVPLLMALKHDTLRLLIADDVGVGKTIEAGLIAREMVDRGEVEHFTVICPPHLCEQWQEELASKFNIQAEVVRTGTATRLERGLRPDESIFEVYPFTVVSLDYIKSDRRRADFLRACPELVIVDEAHTCTQSNTSSRHQRYQLVKGLADAKPAKHMLFLTATPHSGDDTAFHNLLGLINSRFADLINMPEGDLRRHLREELADHFVQRRRGDIAEWRDSTAFPIRESRETTYRLSGDWGQLFDEVFDYARGMVRRAETGTKLQQRMSWWAALALLRCVSSSPAAASIALRTRLQTGEGEPEQQQIADIEHTAAETVLDGEADDALTLNESVPAGTIQSPEDVAVLRRLINHAENIRGVKSDPKLASLVHEVEALLDGGFKPVVFCRYIATAHYVAENLKIALSTSKSHVIAITGELTSDQRAEQIEEIGLLGEGIKPVLVATDCLSEGVNLQRHFDAVVHYDLTWNPTRHEQREGRVDRFGQSARVVRALMLYGQNNPVDGAVLKVILRKAEKIRKELGVAVPVPADNAKVVDAIMRAVLLHAGGVGNATQQIAIDFQDTETELDGAWEMARDRMTRTVFAQRRLRPDDVLPEWRKAIAVLGGEGDVARFASHAAERLGASLERRKDHYRLPLGHLPKALQERLESLGLKNTVRISFQQPAPSGVLQIHRSHPLIVAFADHISESALDIGDPALGARSCAIYAAGVNVRTTIYFIRLRYQIAIERREPSGSYAAWKTLLAEECLGVAVRGSATPVVLDEIDALGLLSLEPTRNMEDSQKSSLIAQAIFALSPLEPRFDAIARARADELLVDHRRIREASDARGMRYSVTPALPVDKIGVYVLMPTKEV